MKLIIDIPEDGYKKIKEYFANDDCGLPTDLAIAKGIPLEKELEKIRQKSVRLTERNIMITGTRADGRMDIIEIIDKHISELKGE